jgi:hypothetical protein
MTRLPKAWHIHQGRPTLCRLPRWTLPATLATGVAGLCVVLLAHSPWPVPTALRHAYDGFHCASTRAAGLAPAQRERQLLAAPRRGQRRRRLRTAAGRE